MFNFDKHCKSFFEEYNYLDYNATTPVVKEVMEAMLPYFSYKFTNPGGKYPVAKSVSEDVEEARENIAELIGAKNKNEIIFTSSATESINQAIRSVLKTHPDKKHIITSSVEHSAVFRTCKDLSRDGYTVDFIGVDQNGKLNIEELKSKIKEDTAIVSIMYANNETGVIFPIDKIASIVKSVNKNTVFHTDATQAVGKIFFKLNQEGLNNVDMLSMSGHKIYGPKGIGLLYIKEGIKVRAFITGGNQEFKKRSGTLNVPSIIGLAKAFELAYKTVQDKKYNDKLEKLRNKLETELVKRVPYMHINGQKSPRVPNTTNIAFDAIEGEALLVQLFKKGIYLSSGSACASSTLEPSRVLSAMGLPITAMHSSLRISLGKWTKEADIDDLIETLPPLVKRLRELSPFWDVKNNCPNEYAIKEAGV